MFEFVRCLKNDVRVRLMFDKMVIGQTMSKSTKNKITACIILVFVPSLCTIAKSSELVLSIKKIFGDSFSFTGKSSNQIEKMEDLSLKLQKVP